MAEIDINEMADAIIRIREARPREAARLESVIKRVEANNAVSRIDLIDAIQCTAALVGAGIGAEAVYTVAQSRNVHEASSRIQRFLGDLNAYFHAVTCEATRPRNDKEREELAALIERLKN